jgi:hypothetical protein
MEGASLHAWLPDLTGLVARGVDEPTWAAQVVQWKTNCATSALGFLAAICGDVDAAKALHPLLATRSVNGMSMPWLMQLGHDAGAWVTYAGMSGRQPRAGDLLHYGTPGQNNDHVEWCLSDPTPAGAADHGGGGRPDNLISVGNGSIVSSAGRPLLAFIDLDKLTIPTVDTYEAT